MIPTIEQILVDLQTGDITAEQAIAWLNEHLRLAQGSAQDDLRDSIAMAALQGMLASETADSRREFPITSRIAYDIADTMLAERARRDSEAAC